MAYIENFHPRLAETAPDGHFKGDLLAMFNDGYVVDSQHLLQKPNEPGRVTHALLPEAVTQARIIPRLAILHTQASSGRASNAAMLNYLRNSSNLEPHLVGPQMDDGKVVQVMPFNVRADVSAKANGFYLPGRSGYYGALSAETQDNGGKTVNQTPWTMAQLGTLCGWLTAVCFTYRIACTDVGWELGSGIAPHNRWPSWSQSAHSCPGTARSNQMDAVRAEVANRLIPLYQACGEACPGAE